MIVFFVVVVMCCCCCSRRGCGWIDSGWGNCIWIEWGGIGWVIGWIVECYRWRIILGVVVELGCVGNAVGGMGDEMIIVE